MVTKYYHRLLGMVRDPLTNLNSDAMVYWDCRPKHAFESRPPESPDIRMAVYVYFSSLNKYVYYYPGGDISRYYWECSTRRSNLSLQDWINNNITVNNMDLAWWENEQSE